MTSSFTRYFFLYANKLLVCHSRPKIMLKPDVADLQPDIGRWGVVDPDVADLQPRCRGFVIRDPIFAILTNNFS